jgi:hypothetical protein
MSDYLNNLVLRTLSPGVGVRPQLPSAFEAGPQRLWGLPAPPDLDSETLVEPDAPALSPVPAPVTLLPPSPTEATPMRTVEQPAVEIPEIRVAAWRKGEPDREVAEAAGDVPPPAPTEENIRPVHPLPPTPPTDRESSMSVTVSPRVIQMPPPALENDRARTPPARRQRQPAATPPQRRGVAYPGPLSPARAAISSQTIEPAARPSERVAVDAIRPLVPATSVLSSSPLDAVAPPPPTVQVTIGRVEVRATPTAAERPRRQAADTNVMSLDAYLRKRAAGGER